MPQSIAKEYLNRQPTRKAGTDWFRIENKKNSDNTETAHVYIYDEIGFWGTSASEFVQQLAAIAADKIDLHLNSPGGEIFDGVAIYNALKGHHATVDVHIDSLAASAASFIAQAGDNIFIARNANMMIHDGLAFVYGNAKDMHDTGNLLDKLSNNIADIYQQRAGGTQEEWRALMQEEVWYSAQEAVDAGLADEVVEIQSGDSGSAENFSLLKVFNHASRKSAPSPADVRERVFNRVKEARMSDTGAPTVGQNPEGQNPEGQQPEGQQPDGQTPDEETTPPAGTPDVAEPTPAAAPAAPAVPPVPDTTAKGNTFAFQMNGTTVTDFSAVQAYINSLEGAQREARENNRKDFVKSLVDSAKITAPQMTATEEFALSLTDEQYGKWVASWDAAPAQPLLGSHAAGGTHGPDSTPTAKADDDEIATAKAILKQHLISNMAVDKIMATASYAKVVAADPKFDLNSLK